MLMRFEELYDGAGIAPASDEFWKAVGLIDSTFGASMRARPIGLMQIEDACRKAERGFISAIHAEQARATVAEGGA